MALTKAERAARAHQYRALRKARRSAPGMMARVADPAISDDALSPVERACRRLREQVHEQVGGPGQLLPTQAMQVDVLLFRYLVVATGQTDVLPLIERHGLLSLRTLKMHPAVVDLDRLLTSFEKTLQAVGQIGPREPKAIDLAEQARLAAAEVAAQDTLAERERTGAPSEQVVEPGRLSHDHRGHEQAPETAGVAEPDPVGAF